MGNSKNTFKALKDGIFKLLGQYSANGNVLGDLSYNRADLSYRLFGAINSAFLRASMSLPTVVKSFEPRFARVDSVFSLGEPEELSGEDSRAIAEGIEGRHFAVSMLCSGVGVFVVNDENGEEMLCEEINAPQNRFERVTLFVDGLCEGEKTFLLKSGNGKSFAVRELEIYLDNGAFENALCIPQKGCAVSLLPCDFGTLESVSCKWQRCAASAVTIKDGVIVCPENMCEGLCIYYTPNVPVVDESTTDETVFDVPDVTFLGVMYLASAELCEISDGELYSRLMYKYRDLALNCYDKKYAPKIRNSFFDVSGKALEGLKCRT